MPGNDMQKTGCHPRPGTARGTRWRDFYSLKSFVIARLVRAIHLFPKKGNWIARTSRAMTI
jgi:hypothetical protein